jgi:transposase-like protein
MDVHAWLRKQLEQASPDLLRAEALTGAEADALRVPDWLLERRAEQAFVAVIADCYLAGVSTRRVEKLVQKLGVDRPSKSQVSRLAQSLDRVVEDVRTRPLDRAPYAYVTLDALEVRCREGGRTVNVCVVHAVGVNRDGFREPLGLDVVTPEDGAGWQRCRTHAMQPADEGAEERPVVRGDDVRTIFAQPDAQTVQLPEGALAAAVVEQLARAAEQGDPPAHRSIDPNPATAP